MNIKIKDGLINEDTDILDVPIEVTPEPIQRTYQTQNEDGTISDVIVNEPQPAKTINLRIEQQRLEEKKAKVEQDQSQLDADTQALQDQQDLCDSIQSTTMEAIEKAKIPVESDTQES